LAVLSRGYALVTDRAGLPITSASGVKPGARLGLRFADGDVKATADGGTAPTRQGLLPL
jgi:exodeoxyribonuclease VII large subunit